MSGTKVESSGWQLGGNAPLAYDTHIVDIFLKDYSRRLIETAGIKGGSRVLDVACGTGVVTRLAAERAGAEGYVVGLDFNAGMLSRARALSEKTSKIDWHEGTYLLTLLIGAAIAAPAISTANSPGSRRAM